MPLPRICLLTQKVMCALSFETYSSDFSMCMTYRASRNTDDRILAGIQIGDGALLGSQFSAFFHDTAITTVTVAMIPDAGAVEVCFGSESNACCGPHTR